jgi:filamentous hemagglutinin family protein
MNKVHRIVWNQALQMWMAVAENAKGHSKSSRSLASAKRRLNMTALVAGLVMGSASLPMAQAAPAGGQVTSGAGSIAQSGQTTTIKQSTQNLSLNWKSFNVGASETVNFVQPSATAIAVNKIFDTNGSQILGNLNANGQVFLINPNGVIFGAGAQVNVGGLVASTLDIASTTAGSTSFSGTGTGSVINLGKITAANGGYVALLGNHVSNQGVIAAQMGTVALGAGSAVTLSFNGSNLVRMVVDQSVIKTLAENGGLIQADGGKVLMTAGAAKSLLASVVNNTGVIEARTVNQQGGTITLLGGMQNGAVNVAGTLDASAPNGGNGGFIETSAAHVQVASDAKVTTVASMGQAGIWLIDPTDFTVAATGGDITGATLSSQLGGGNITITSSSGATGTAGNVNVNDAVTWAANKLTLNAQNDITINANLNGSGTASLALQYGQGSVATGNTSSYSLNNGAQVNLPAGSNFSTLLGSDGVITNYTVITSLGNAGSTTATDLQGINGGLSGNYALGGNIDATSTASWNGGAGFAPIADGTTSAFSGKFDGLGHTIFGLTINLPSQNNVGLFGYMAFPQFTRQFS